MSRVWVVRAGSQGSLIDLALDESVVFIGWGELGDLAAIPDQETLRARVDDVYADNAAPTRTKHFSQNRAFRFTIQTGDLVIAPGPPPTPLHIGRISGDCQYRPDNPAEARQTRPVRWLGEVDRHDLAIDLQNTLGSLLTVYEVKQESAEERFLAVMDGLSDPGPADTPEPEGGEPSAKKLAQVSRLRAAMQLLADKGPGMHKDELYRQVVEVVPLVPGEEGTTTNGQASAQVAFEFMTTPYSTAAWLCKFQGTWTITRAGRQALQDYPDPLQMWEAAERLPEDLGLTTADPPPTAEDLQRRLVAPPEDFGVRRLARAMLLSGLGSGRSTIDPQVHAWSSDTAQELHRVYTLRPDESGRKFLDKLQDQLAGASDAAILLAAELVTLHQLPLLNLTASSKRDRLRTILSWTQEPYSPTPEMYAAFTQGTWHGGQGAHTLIWRALRDLIEFVKDWWQLDDAVRKQALEDPWIWSDLVASSQALTLPNLREALRYLAFPHHFLSTTSHTHKQLMAAAFAGEVPQPTGEVDKDLFDITLKLQQEVGGPVDFYRSPWVEIWKPAPSTERSWLVRGSAVGGRNLIPEWTSQGFVSLPTANLSPIDPPYERSTVAAAVSAALTGKGADYRRRKTLDYTLFLHDIRPGDLVVTQADRSVWVGTVEGEPEWTAQDQAVAGLRRRVNWDPTEFDRADLPESLQEKLKGIQNDVTDISDEREAIAGLLQAAPGAPEEPVVPTPEAALREPTTETAADLHIPLEWLQKVTRLMGRRRQAILYGPPGTGKTYVARALAEQWTDPENVTLVQFHPSVSYEDFIAGFRPTQVDSGIGFALRQGPFMRLAERAKEDPGNPYILIVDEINRANLAKVFGELYFLLEYRDAPVEPLYADDNAATFSLPKNVYIIGTMNTADRSIVLVDAAMRRRFAFLEMHPKDPPVNGVLRSWLAAAELPGEAADLLDALNARTGNRDFAIGPSYFMKPWIYTEDDGLEEVWETDLLPLLAEHHAGEDVNVRDRYGLEVLRRSMAAGPV